MKPPTPARMAGTSRRRRFRRPGKPDARRWLLLLLVAGGVLFMHTAPATAAAPPVHAGMVPAASPTVHPAGPAAVAFDSVGQPGMPGKPVPPGHQGVHTGGVCLAVLTGVGLLLGLLLLLTGRRAAGGRARPPRSTAALRSRTSFRIGWPPDLHALGVLRL